ncbi:MAG: RNA methyltransferase [Bacteroidales bacterium]|nr:RNA methyltransferase [Bacteroidales bacterium]
MLSKARIKFLNALRLPKYRQEEGLFIAEGVKLINEALKSSFDVLEIFATREWIEAGYIPASRYLVDVTEISEEELGKITALSTPNQVLAVIRQPLSQQAPPAKGEWVIALDQIRDPGNLGTMIRTADWFGIHRIVASRGSVEVWNPKVVQASMGSVFRMPVHTVNLPEYLAENEKYVPVYGTLLEGEMAGTIPLGKQGIVIIGNESHGISPEVMPFITRRITIPAAGQGRGDKAESLNASIAMSILCYEIRRQNPLNTD